MSPTDREYLLKNLRRLNTPDQGMSYSSGRFDRQRYCEDTGRPLPREHRPAEITLYGDRANFIYWLIRNSEEVASILEDLSEQSQL